MDESKRSIGWLESVALTTEFGLVHKQTEACREKPSTPHIVDRIPLNCDMRSFRSAINCLDTQRAREAKFFDFKVLSDHLLSGRCQAFSQIELAAPTMSDEVMNAELLSLNSMLWGGPSMFKSPEKARDNGHEECQVLQLVFNHPISWRHSTAWILLGCSTVPLLKEGGDFCIIIGECRHMWS